MLKDCGPNRIGPGSSTRLWPFDVFLPLLFADVASVIQVMGTLEDLNQDNWTSFPFLSCLCQERPLELQNFSFILQYFDMLIFNNLS